MKTAHKMLAVAGCVSVLVAGVAAQPQINGAGATFPNPIYSKWFDEYHKLHPERRDQLPVDRLRRRHPAAHRRRRCSSAPPTAR